MKINLKDYVALSDVVTEWADLSKRDPNDPYANNPFFVKKNEEAQRRLKRSYWPKEVFERKN